MYPFGSNNIDPDLLKNMMSGMNTQPMEEHTVKVNGINGANALNLAPNSDKLVLDMNDPIVWFIQTDGAGYKTVTGYDIRIHKEVKQEDLMKSFEKRLNKLEEAVRNGKSYNPVNDSKPRTNASNYDASSRGDVKG